ncbi:beta-galactosidase domain 4-containing protein [Prevotella sp. 10(H)]|uniref:beta-galactosidase domain 4-containing protein n=1 Tax=Prevotella sp. 10(H) TaxID=1158294 RepID=UPI0021018A30|nr:beta-galactosidase domain 4-containing protein [Prevotella sp. 10(H)]
MKKIYQYIKFKPTALSAGKVEIENKYDFLNLNEFDISWIVLREGIPVESGTLQELNLVPNEKTVIEFPFKRRYDPGKEYFLNISATLKNKTSWAEKGHQIASAQFALTPRPAIEAIDNSVLAALNVKTEGSNLIISGSGFSTAFNTATGKMTSLQYGNTEYLYKQNGLNLNWYRSVGNDKFTDQNYYPVLEDKPVFIYSVADDNKSVILISDFVATINSPTPVKLPYSVKYTVYGNGMIDVEGSFTKPSTGAIIRRLGLQMQLPEGFENIKYYGKGPHESYIDRIKSAYVGLYSTTPKGMEYEHYVRAQSLGNREDVRWIEISDGKMQV